MTVIVERIDNPEIFRRLRGEWTELVEASPSNGFFVTWEWLHTWWTHLSEGRRLSILTVRNDGQLVAIAPLAQRLPRLRLLQPFRTVEFLGMGGVGSDYLDVIVRRGMEERATRALAAYLSPEKQLLELAQFQRGNGCTTPVLAGHLREWRWSAREFKINSCPFIDLSGHSWESYLATIGPNYRRNFKRRLRQLTERYTVNVRMAQSEDQRREFLEALLTIHGKRWQTRGEPGAFPTPAYRAFHTELSQLALHRGWLRLYIMWLDGRPAAAFYGFSYNRRFLFYQQGFDPSYSRYSLGLVMTGLMIQEAIKEGADEFDFLSGEEDFKFHWTGTVREVGRLELYPPGMRGLWRQETLRVRRMAWQWAKRMLPPNVVRRIVRGAPVDRDIDAPAH